MTAAGSSIQAPSPRRPRVGVTPDIEWRPDACPAREHYTLDARLTEALGNFGALPLVLPHDEGAIGAMLSQLDGLVLSGGEWQFPHRHLLAGDGKEPPHKARRARFELALARAALACDMPILGICGGFEVLNEVTGGELVVNLSAEHEPWHRHAAGSYTHLAHEVVPVAGSVYASIAVARKFAVNSRHRQGVTTVGPAARVAASSDDGLVEAIEIPDRRFAMGTQWHPEFLLNEADHRLLRSFVNACVGFSQPTR